MNKLYRSLMLMLLCFVSLPSKAAETEVEAKELGFWVELQAVSSRLPTKAIVWYEKDLTDHFGFYAFVWKESDGYQEYIVGPTWKPIEGLQFGLGVGRETVPEEGNSSRRMFFVDATHGDFNFYAAFENGKASGPWKKVTATYAITEHFGLGVMHETGLGNGPRFEWNVRKNVQVWGAVLHGRSLETETGIEKKSTALLAINFSF